MVYYYENLKGVSEYAVWGWVKPDYILESNY